MTGRIAKLAGLTTLFVVAFLGGLFVTAPMGLVTRVVEAQAEAAADYRWDVDIDRTRFSGLTGIKLIGVTLTPRPVEDGEVRLPVRLDSVRASVSLFGLVSGTVRARVDIGVGDGRVRVNYGPAEDDPVSFKVECFDVELSRFPPIADVLGMPLTGLVNGTVELQYDDEQRLSGGGVEVSVAGAVLGPGSIESEEFRQFGGEIPLPATDFGNLLARASIDGSTVAIDTIEASGTDVRISMGGQVELRQPFRSSRVTVPVDFQLDGTYVEEAGLGPVLGMPQLQRLQTGSGYSMTLSGLLGNLSMEPAVRGRRAR